MIGFGVAKSDDDSDKPYTVFLASGISGVYDKSLFVGATLNALRGMRDKLDHFIKAEVREKEDGDEKKDES